MRLAYRADGPDGAPVLVLVGSLGTTTALWEPTLELLVPRFRVLRVDLPGHGASPVPDAPFGVDDVGRAVLDVLDELEVERAFVCGLSLGGMVAMWLGADAAQRVQRLVLACTAPVLRTPAAWAERAALVRAEGTAAVLDTAREAWFTDAFRATSSAQRCLDELVTIPAEGYARCCEALGAFDFSAELARVASPTLVVHGELDPVVRPVAAEALAQGIPGARLAGIAQAAHLAAVERPAAFAAALLGHLAGRRGPTSEEIRERGMRIRREVLGDEHVDRAVEGTSDLTRDFQDLVTRYAWGEIWARPGLDRRTRSCVTLAVLVALGRFDELGLHVRAARRNGLSHAEIQEVLLHTAVYCGVPAANRAFAVFQRVVEEDAEPG